MFSPLHKLCGVESQTTKRNRKRSESRRSLAMEGLETRELMAIDLLAQQVGSQQFQPLAPATVSVSIVNHDLYIYGTNGADKVEVTQENLRYIVNVTTMVNGRRVTQSTSWRPTGGDIFFYGYGGNDNFSNLTFLRANVDGGDGNDTLSGGYGADNIKGGNGDDVLRGNGAHDFLDGGSGSDTIYGGDGNDTILCGPDFAPNRAYGGPGNDTITGGYGMDYLFGDAGNDTLDGSYGADDLFGGDGIDWLYAGNDSEPNRLDGGAGEDHMYGSYGNDHMIGGAGNDWMFGYAGNDYLDGGSGRDYMFGGAGDDYLYGGSGYDYVSGGDGDDDLNGGGDDDVVDCLVGGRGRDTFFFENYIDDSWGIDYNPPMGGEVRDFEIGVDRVIY